MLTETALDREVPVADAASYERVEAALHRLGEAVVAPRPPAALRARVMADAHRFAAWPALALTLLDPAALMELVPEE